MRKFTVGNIDDINRPARNDTSVRSALASENRFASSGSRTNARTTRMPVICSRSTRFTWSMRSCIRRNAGTIRETSSPSTTAATGIATTSTIDSSTLWRTARMTPTTIVIGAAMAIVHAHHHQHLHLLHVVRDARDQRRRAELADLSGREIGDLVEEVLAQVAAEAHRDAAAVEHGGRREHDLDDREEQHHAAPADDVRGVAGKDAVVDDARDDRGQRERGRGLHRLQQHDEQQRVCDTGRDAIAGAGSAWLLRFRRCRAGTTARARRATSAHRRASDVSSTA